MSFNWEGFSFVLTFFQNLNECFILNWTGLLRLTQIAIRPPVSALNSQPA